MKKNSTALLLMAAVCQLCAQRQYSNPVIDNSVPDPTIVRTPQGIFYLYGTENIRNVPIYASRNLVNWTYRGTAFTDQTRPQMVPNGNIWAPDINLIGERYV